MPGGLEVSQSQSNAKDARIEGINELMLQAKVPENLGRLEVVPEALALTKSLHHLIRVALCPQMPPEASACASCPQMPPRASMCLSL
jgi:hypothetical protein